MQVPLESLAAGQRQPRAHSRRWGHPPHCRRYAPPRCRQACVCLLVLVRGVRVCVCVRMRTCTSIYLSVYLSIYLYICMYIHTHTRIHAPTYILNMDPYIHMHYSGVQHRACGALANLASAANRNKILDHGQTGVCVRARARVRVCVCACVHV